MNGSCVHYSAKNQTECPDFEWMVDHRVREALVPEAKDALEFYDLMDWDAVIVDPVYKKEKVSEDRWLSEWGFVTQDTPEEHGIEVELPIKTLADFEQLFTP